MLVNLKGKVYATEFSYRVGMNSNTFNSWNSWDKILKIGIHKFLSFKNLPVNKNLPEYEEIFQSCQDLEWLYPVSIFEREVGMVHGTVMAFNNRKPNTFRIVEVPISDKYSRRFIEIPKELRDPVKRGKVVTYIPVGENSIEPIIITSKGLRFDIY